MYGGMRRLLTKPGSSRTRSGRRLILAANFVTAAIVRERLSSARTISSIGGWPKGTKKWHPQKRPGSSSTLASFPIGMVDVFEASTEWSANSRSNSASNCRLAKTSSKIASTTRSQRPTSASRRVGRTSRPIALSLE